MYKTFAAMMALPLLVSPAVAADLARTHQEIAVPPGKLHARAFRPLDKPACKTAVINPSGSRIAAAPVVDKSSADCAKPQALASATAR